MKAHCLFFLVFLLYISPGRAQNVPIRFKHFTTNHGLSQNNVTSVLQDSRGFMWFGTQDGLNKFDGYGFKIYRNNPNRAHSLSDSYIWKVFEDRQGRIWVGTDNGGLNLFDRTTDRFTRYINKPGDPKSLSHNKVTAIAQDRDGKIWVGTYGGGLNLFDPATGTFSRFVHNVSRVISWFYSCPDRP